MNLEWIGIILAALVVGTIAFGHAFVKRIHAQFGTRPAVPLMVLGILILAASITSKSDPVSAVLGIIGVTTFWDGIEVIQQKKRVQRDEKLDQGRQ